MEKLLKLLGLKKEATEDQIIEAFSKLKADNELLTENLETAQKEITALEKKLKGVKPAHPKEELVLEKVRAGLSRTQAEEVVAAQDAEDADKEAAQKKK